MLILVVDDERQMRQMITRSLADAGYETIEAKDGRKALHLFRIHRPDLVITDILMPEQEGIETIIQLRHHAPDLPILAISGGSNWSGPLNYLDVALQLGATAALEKPFRIAQLLDTVTRLLASSSEDAGA